MIAILAVISRKIVEPAAGDGAAYIEQDTEVRRFHDGTPLTGALSVMEKEFPSALSFEIYRPRTDASAVPRV